MTSLFIELAALGGESADETFICQHVGADRWTTASVEIAEATAPEKTISISPRNGELSEKAGAGSRGDKLLGPGKGRLGAGGTIWEKTLCSEGSMGGKWVYAINRREVKKIIPVRTGRRLPVVSRALIANQQAVRSSWALHFSQSFHGKNAPGKECTKE